MSDGNKVRVTDRIGFSHPLGTMNPHKWMRAWHGTQQYTIAALKSGNLTVDLSLASGDPVVAQAYPFNLVVDAVEASGHGWPDGADCTLFGRSETWPDGVPHASGEWMVSQDGDGTPDTFLLS